MITDDAFPAFYRASDAASASYQRKFLVASAFQLGMLIVIAAFGSWSPPPGEDQSFHQNIVGYGVAGPMFIALISGFLVKHQRYDDRWFQCRAFAENAKTATWRFMMLPDVTDAQLRAELEEIGNRYPDIIPAVSRFTDDGPLVTEVAKEARKRSVAERAATYRRERIDNQRKWYRAKARANHLREQTFFWGVAVLEIAAFGFAVVAGPRGWQVNPTGAIATIATVFLAWSQTKRYSDLNTSYSQTAFDLDKLFDTPAPTTDQDLKDLVDAVETTVSREHRMWLTKRGVGVQ